MNDRNALLITFEGVLNDSCPSLSVRFLLNMSTDHVPKRLVGFNSFIGSCQSIVQNTSHSVAPSKHDEFVPTAIFS